MGGMPWKVTVVYGKESIEVAFESQGTKEEGEKFLSYIQQQVTLNFGIEKEYQKLVYRGHELKDGTTLKNPSKIMLLLNQKYYEKEKESSSNKKTLEVSPSSVAVAAETEAEAEAEAVNFTTIPSTRSFTSKSSIDLEDVGEKEILVQVTRGKHKYAFIFPRESQVKIVKNRLEELTGVDGNEIRLVMKGKTPHDKDLLEQFYSSPSQRIIKCMLLLKASQHIYMEKQSELCDLQNELTQLQLQKKQLERQLAKNFGSKEEMAIEWACLKDAVKNIVSNLDILQDVLLIHKKKASASTCTSKLTAQTVLFTTMKEAKELVIAVEKLQNHFKTY